MTSIGILLLAQSTSTNGEDNGFSVPILMAAAAAAVAWLLLAALTAAVRRPPGIDPGSYTQELPPYSPAVTALLCDDFELGSETAPATLLDLAARRVVTLEEVQPGQTVCRVRASGGDEDLTPYERRVLDVVRERAIDGVVPAAALTTGVDEVSRGWQRGLAKDVIHETQAAGLSRDRWPAGLVGLLGFGVIVGIGLLVLAAIVGGDVEGQQGVRAGIAGVVTVLALLALSGVVARMRRSLAQLPTDAGVDAARRCLGFQTHLHENENFDALPPASVAIWGRHLAYATAVGAAQGCAAALPMGAEDDHHAWSRFGSRWRRVRVRYPRALPPGWGKHPAFALFLAVVWGAVGILAVSQLTRLAGAVADEPATDEILTREVLDWIGRGALLLCIPFGLAVLWALYVLVRAVPDLWLRRTVTGEVVRKRTRQQVFKAGDDPKYWYFLALDDGRRDRIRAWRVRPEIYRAHRQGETVTTTLTPNLGYVREMRTA